MVKNNIVPAALIVFSLSAPALADSNIYSGLGMYVVRETVTECAGDCSIPFDPNSSPPLTLVAGVSLSAVPYVGLEARFSNEPSLQLMYRRYFGSSIFTLGAGLMRQETSMRFGNNTEVGHGSLHATESAVPIYSAALERQLEVGQLGIMLSRSRFDGHFSGRIVTGFSGSGTAIFSDASATAQVEKSYVMLYYSYTAK